MFVLYQQDLLRLGAEEAIARVQQDEVQEHTLRLVLGVDARRAEIDDLLADNLSGWRLERLGLLERAVLRVAAYELLFDMETPVAVVVDEAVTLAKRFCSSEAGSLVNGILGGVARVTRGPEAKAEERAKEAL